MMRGDLKSTMNPIIITMPVPTGIFQTWGLGAYLPRDKGSMVKLFLLKMANG